MSLHAVPDEPHEEPSFTPFCGKEVVASRLRVTSTGIEIDGEFDIDDIVEVTLEVRINAVQHNVRESTGELERIQRARIIDVVETNVLARPDGRA